MTQQKTIGKSVCKGLFCALVLGNAGTALATEGGGSIYPNGNENYLTGALPPPGVYWLAYLASYDADTLRDNNGDKVPIPFSVKANAIAPRVVWVTNQKILGGQLAFHSIAPLVDLKVDVLGQSQHKTGLGDMVFGSALGYHASDKLHYVFAIDLNAPTGGYNKNDLANIGRNYWNLEPLFAVSYVQPTGINADLKVMYDFNGRNNDTHYRSGQELHADYSAGWGFGNGWVAGVGGYVYRQTTDDNVSGTDVGNRGKALAIGPSIKYDNGKGFFITAKWQKEYSVVNRAEGSEFKIKIKFPF